MRLPTWDELIPEQRDILEAPLDAPLFVVGPPGSGKTTLAVQRANMVRDMGQDVVVITYNRMLRRLVALLTAALQASTMQSYVCSDYWRRARARVPKLPRGPYALNWRAILDHLGSQPCGAHNRGHTVVDEGQDLPEEFFRYAADHMAPTLSVFADENQAVSATRTTLEQIKRAAGLPAPILLKANHRNTPEIARVAEFFHSGRVPVAAVRRASTGERPRLIYSPSTDHTCDLIANTQRTRGGTIGVVVHYNDLAEALHSKLTRALPGQRVALYTNTLKNEDFIDVRQPGITLLNKESVKGQEFDALFLLELESFLPCQDDHQRRIMYMLCARARDQLMLVHGPRPLTVEAMASLPPENLLERT